MIKKEEKIASSMPKWFQTNHQEIAEGLRFEKEFYAFWRRYNDLKDMLLEAPEMQKMAELRKREGKFYEDLNLESYTADAVLIMIIESNVARFSATQLYKTKGIFEGLDYALTNCNYLVAVSLLRSLLEETCFQHFHLMKLKEKSQLFFKILRDNEKQTSRRKPPKKVSDKYINVLLDIVNMLDRAMIGSDFDWSKHLKETAGVDITRENAYRKVNVMDVLRYTEKKTGVKAMHFYDLLSDMSHPNAGSNMLVIRDRPNAEQPIGDITISHNGATIDHSRFFFDTVLAYLPDLLKLSLDNINRSNHFARAYQKIFPDDFVFRFYAAVRASDQRGSSLDNLH
ncbi:hypothetical protein OAL10_10295 [Gammaproteobacteria bacterium]|nr:hypothetical protein [Gammaproteobacteria bacterium]